GIVEEVQSRTKNVDSDYYTHENEINARVRSRDLDVRLRAIDEANDESRGRSRVRRPGNVEIRGRTAAGAEGKRNARAHDRRRCESGRCEHSLRQIREVFRNDAATHSWVRPRRSG